MKSVTDTLNETAEEINGLLRILLLEHSALYERYDNYGPIVLISPYGNYSYRALQETGRQIQSKLLEEYRRFSELLKVLLKEQPQDALRHFANAETIVLRTIEQQPTWCKTTQEAYTRAAEALQTQFSLLKNLYDPSAGDAYCVPDTNALLYNPVLEKWEFAGATPFGLVLAPTVLKELDVLKINHRNEAVRQKAESLINQVKEFRRRGKLTDGVTLVRGKSTLLAIAVEPNMQDSLPWLDATNNDDRFLATVIEVMRSYPRSVVFAVSRDINFQNKAEFARIPCTEPPEPPAG